MKNLTVKLVELGNPFLDIIDVRWGRFHTGQLRHNEILIENFKEHQSMIWESTNVYKDDDFGVYVFRVVR
jgi:hypothetical protein